MKKGKKLYEGKAKIIYATNDKNLVIQNTLKMWIWSLEEFLNNEKRKKIIRR